MELPIKKNATPKKKSISDIKALEKLILLGGKNLDHIIDLLEALELEDDKILFADINSLLNVFRHLLNSGTLQPNSQGSDDKLQTWLLDRYKNTCEKFGDLLQGLSRLIQEAALNALIKLADSESAALKTNASGKVRSNQLAHIIEPLVKGMLSESTEQDTLIGRLKDHFLFDDFRYWFMKTAQRNLKTHIASASDEYKKNVFTLLTSVSLVKSKEGDLLNNCLLSRPVGAGEAVGKWTSYKEQQKVFSTLAMTFLSCELPADLYEKVLLSLSDKFIPHMSNPRLLCDFLTSSFNIGGVTSVLALNALFILMTQFNLDYPDFFEKLYSLLESSLLHVKHLAQFFTLLDLFLSSSHLPAYLVAAFIKRLARLALVSPPHTLPMLITFIYNLLRRHPSCMILVNRPVIRDFASDPFLVSEKLPAKSHAMDSALWELETLEQHYHHSVATLAQKRRYPLGNEEEDFSVVVQQAADANSLFQSEVKKQHKEVALTFLPAQSLFGNKEDKLHMFWSIS